MVALGQISWLDCFVFLLFLVPQLIIHVGFLKTAMCGIKALPFLTVRLPVQLLHERYWTPKKSRPPFVQEATLFQDVVIRCVRYAFAEIPASIGRVFLSRSVAWPFFKFRMLRHGIWKSPIFWWEVQRTDFKGLFAIYDKTQKPDIVLYYCHGGGFSMGSSFFYLEFLILWLHLLKHAGYKNPALFALEYTLVPEATYPTQIHEAMAGYKYVLSLIKNPSHIVVAGDSAGATLVLALLLYISGYSSIRDQLPGLAVIISPWTTILSNKIQNTSSDYLNANSLHLYGLQYIGKNGSNNNALVSPGRCYDLSWWKRASPSQGWYFVYGAEEAFAPEARELADKLRKADLRIDELEEPGWIHAWPFARLFLCNRQEDRQSGVKAIVEAISQRIERTKAE